VLRVFICGAEIKEGSGGAGGSKRGPITTKERKCWFDFQNMKTEGAHGVLQFALGLGLRLLGTAPWPQFANPRWKKPRTAEKKFFSPQIGAGAPRAAKGMGRRRFHGRLRMMRNHGCLFCLVACVFFGGLRDISAGAGLGLKNYKQRRRAALGNLQPCGIYWKKVKQVQFLHRMFWGPFQNKTG